ncbi:predicted protein [Naegleria gruberi]|uniref:Predicted protein n=1 Tax=Naegleria gruberi TaxID=5762 RepID=D2VJH6_NAEGR|nr:uncharacterized protein NAEGRDRAFT_69041 [Naegleria gruberi]EFC43041.1 predicted protein [Naegleria gruberi]|eukprot:XP_002675785.1 predicted protein [Naegleria gruberi strain NEG-M]
MFDDTLYRNHFIMKQSRKRFLNIDKSDWDLVCMDIGSLKELLISSSGKVIREVRINYLIKVQNFTHENLNDDSEEEVTLRINEILPKDWKEISVCLQLNCGSIIEIEYCND